MNKIIVHGGTFHADDAGCVAIMRLVNPAIDVARVFQAPPEEPGVIVADIGRGRYDHHQEDAAVREDGGKRAAIGLVFADYGRQLFPTDEAADAFERDFIIPIEDCDNGVASNPLSVAVGSLNPDWDSEESFDEAFMKAVDFLTGIFKREIDRAHSSARAASLVEAAPVVGGDILHLDRFCPWDELVTDMIRGAIFPSNRGGFNLMIRRGAELLPESWLEDAPEGCTFVHQGRFIAAFESDEAAVNAALSL